MSSIDSLFSRRFSVYSRILAHHNRQITHLWLRLRVVSNFGDGDRGNFALGRVCISTAPHSPSPKLETTRSLHQAWLLIHGSHLSLSCFHASRTYFCSNHASRITPTNPVMHGCRYLFPLFVYSLVETEITIDLLTRVIISNWGPVISIE